MIASYQGKGKISRLIKWQTRSSESHTAWLCRDGSLIESWQKRGVDHVPNTSSLAATLGVNHTPGTMVRLFRIEPQPSILLSPEKFDMIEGFLRQQVGKKYDWRSVARFVTRREEHPNDKDKWFCTELVFASVLEAAIALLARTKAHEVSPGMLLRSPLLVELAHVETI